jgi:hypothetical protein
MNTDEERTHLEHCLSVSLSTILEKARCNQQETLTFEGLSEKMRSLKAFEKIPDEVLMHYIADRLALEMLKGNLSYSSSEEDNSVVIVFLSKDGIIH